MSEYSFAKRMQQHRPVAAVNNVRSTAHRFDRVERIRPIAVYYRQVPQPAKILGHNRIGGLFGYRYRYPVAVVLNDENDRQAFAACSVERLEHVAFRARRFTLAAKHDRVSIVV